MLTDSQVRTLKLREAAYRIADANSLCLEVRPSGAKVGRYRYRLAGRASLVTIGEYPTMGLSAARAERERLRALVKGGGNPALSAKIERAIAVEQSESTFGGGGFIPSMQYVDSCLSSRNIASEAKEPGPLHGHPEGLDVGPVAARRVAPPDCSAVRAHSICSPHGIPMARDHRSRRSWSVERSPRMGHGAER